MNTHEEGQKYDMGICGWFALHSEVGIVRLKLRETGHGLDMIA